jgi:hypothetical protein
MGKHRLHWLHLYLNRFTAVPSSPDLCSKWAEVMVAAEAAGRRIDCADAWIAATASLYGVVLLTHNRLESGVPLQPFDPLRENPRPSSTASAYFFGRRHRLPHQPRNRTRIKC